MADVAVVSEPRRFASSYYAEVVFPTANRGRTGIVKVLFWTSKGSNVDTGKRRLYTPD